VLVPDRQRLSRLDEGSLQVAMGNGNKHVTSW
jgi:hypothetical protein